MNTNELYTYNYSQPEEYHFSLDSIFLAQKVAKIYKTHPQLNSVNCLDLCAGTGVIGLELSIYLNDIKNIDFIEVQSEYLGHFENNFHGIHGLNSDRNFKYYQKNYEVVLTENNSIHFNKYDLILCNPPYFFSNEGILSPSNFKNRCRFFLDSNLEMLIKALHFMLKDFGKAYLLMRPGTHHGRDLFRETKNLLPRGIHAEIIDEVRGTHVVCLAKES